MRVLLPRGTSQRTSSTGTRVRLASGLLPGCGWPRWCGARLPVGLIWSPAFLGLAVGLGDPWAYCRGVVVLGCAAGAWVPVGLLLGLVVIHPVRERRACCWCRPGHQGSVKEDHVF